VPELPDVEVFRRVLQRRGLGRAIAHVAVTDRRILGKLSTREFSRRLTGKKLVRARRYGKHLLAKIDGDGWLTLHFGLTGALQPYKDPQKPPPYYRVRLDFSKGEHLAYINRRMIGRVGWTDDAEKFIAAENLGPDALGRRFTFADFKKAMTGHRRDVKSVLMDQAVVAGIGNIYADEILFQARIDPRARSNGLAPAQLRRLHRTITKVLKTAVARGAGSENFAEHLPKSFLLPARKKGGRCPRCAAALKTLKSGGHTGYFCPRCQG
jgi:formamidopyrimidine-DNA glycosylase